MGGLNEFVKLFFGQLLGGFAYLTGTSVLAKGLYKQTNFHGLHVKKADWAKYRHLKYDTTYHKVVPIDFLELRFMIYKCFFCCRKAESMKKFGNY